MPRLTIFGSPDLLLVYMRMLRSKLLRTLDSSRVRALMVGVLLFGALYFLADFSGRQSLVLAAIGGSLFGIVLWLQKPPFVPYHVFVTPNMRSILTDFQLVQNTEEAWAYVQEVTEKLPRRPGNVWEDGFSVSLVTPELIYDDQWKEFATAVKLSAEVNPGDTLRAGWWKDEITPSVLPDWSGSVSLYFERAYLGYSLGVVFWKGVLEKVRDSEAVKRIPQSDIKEIGEGGVKVKVELAFIPDEEFMFYSTHSHLWRLKALESAVRRRDEARAKYGWKKPQEKWPSRDPSQVIEHRYYTVSHSVL